jgi:cytosine/adenosine deaminase-related metal-dependent hydrolase
MIAHIARWVLPVSAPPLRDGAVVVESDLIVEVGPAREVLKGFSGEIRDHGNGAILPGLVNCHVHLEFSALRGMVPPQDRWEDWLDATLSAFGALTPQEVEAGIAQGVRALWQSGTILAGEVTNTGASWPHLHQGPLDYHLFYECLGFHLLHQADLEELFPFFGAPAVGNTPRVSAGAHAPYSVSPALFGAVGRWNGARGRPQTVHLAESLAELDFLARGDGFFRDLLKRRGRWVADFQPPGLGPAAYLAGLDFLGPRTLAVHGVWLNKADCELLALTGTWLVICPRANRYTGAGTPPVPELVRAGVPLTLGTDSLAGNWDLNLFGEMLRLYEEFPHHPGDLWLRLGTLNGARALRREADLGSLEPGKKAAMGFIPLTGSGDFWGELFTAGDAGDFRWIN